MDLYVESLPLREFALPLLHHSLNPFIPPLSLLLLPHPSLFLPQLTPPTISPLPLPPPAQYFHICILFIYTIHKLSTDRLNQCLHLWWDSGLCLSLAQWVRWSQACMHAHTHTHTHTHTYIHTHCPVLSLYLKDILKLHPSINEIKNKMTGNKYGVAVCIFINKLSINQHRH